MNPTPNSNPAASGTPAPKPSGRLPDILKATREKKRFSLHTIHQETRISVAFLEALESGSWKAFPAEVYLVGFLRKYASYLGLNPDEMVALYRKELEPPPAADPSAPKAKEPAAAAEPEGEPAPATPLRAALLGLLLLVLGGVIVYTLVQPSPERVPGAPSQPAPVPNLQSKFSRSGFVQGAPLALGVKAVDTVWVRIVSDGKLLFEGFLNRGSEPIYEAKDQLQVRVGNANSLRLYLNGREIDPRKGAKQDVNELVLTHQSLLDESLTAQPAPEAVLPDGQPAERPAAR